MTKQGVVQQVGQSGTGVDVVRWAGHQWLKLGEVGEAG